MAGGYSHDQKGIDAVVAMVRDLQRQINEIRSAAGIKSAIIRGHKVEFQDATGIPFATFGQADALVWDTFSESFVTETINGLSILLDTGTPFAYLAVKEDWGAPQAYFNVDQLYAYVEYAYIGTPDGDTSHVIVDTNDVVAYAPTVLVEGSNRLLLSTENFEMGVYGLPNTSNPANIHLGTVGGKFTLAQVTSSRRFKTDIDDAVIEPREVLSIEPRTWIDKGDAAAAGTMVPKAGAAPKPGDENADLAPFIPPRQIGFIAEEAYERETLQQFVGLDSEGLPQSFDYDRFASVGLHAVCKAQQAEIDDLKSTVASLAARLEALEAKT